MRRSAKFHRLNEAKAYRTRPAIFPIAPKPAYLYVGTFSSCAKSKLQQTYIPRARSCSPLLGNKVVIIINAEGIVLAAPTNQRSAQMLRRSSQEGCLPIPWKARNTNNIGPLTAKPQIMLHMPTQVNPATKSVSGPYIALNLPPCHRCQCRSRITGDTTTWLTVSKKAPNVSE